MENTRNLNEKPSWLELPEEEKINHTYWYCTGVSLNLDKRPISERWLTLFHSQEEAEAHACRKKRFLDLGWRESVKV